MTDRVYNSDQANRALPLVRSIVEDLLRTQEEHASAVKEYEALRGKPQGDQTTLNLQHRALRDTEAERVACLHELDELQIVVEDIELGRVGFPSELDGTEVLLSWQPGDEHVDQYHGLDEAFGARRPLPVPVHAE